MACDQLIHAVAKQLQWAGLYPDIFKQLNWSLFYAKQEMPNSLSRCKTNVLS